MPPAHKMPQKLPAPCLGRGRVQRAAERVAALADGRLITSADVLRSRTHVGRCCAGFHCGRATNRLAWRALERIAVRVRRGRSCKLERPQQHPPLPPPRAPARAAPATGRGRPRAGVTPRLSGVRPRVSLDSERIDAMLEKAERGVIDGTYIAVTSQFLVTATR
jgi:hypothetical protein